MTFPDPFNPCPRCGSIRDCDCCVQCDGTGCPNCVPFCELCDDEGGCNGMCEMEEKVRNA